MFRHPWVYWSHCCTVYNVLFGCVRLAQQDDVIDSYTTTPNNKVPYVIYVIMIIIIIIIIINIHLLGPIVCQRPAVLLLFCFFGTWPLISGKVCSSPVKSMSGLGRRSHMKYWLKHFAHPSREFYRGWSCESAILPHLLTLLAFELPLFQNRATHWKSKTYVKSIGLMSLRKLVEFGSLSDENWWLIGIP